MNDIAKVLSLSSPSSAQRALQAIRDGGGVTPIHENGVRYLLELYCMRLNRLWTQPGVHAAKLAVEVEEMLENLRTASSVQTAVIKGPNELLLYIFLTDSAPKAIGCLSGIDRRKASKDQWAKLWEKHL